MNSIVRATTAMATVLVFAGIPLANDWCAVSCTAARSSAQAGAPTCHHLASPTARVGRAPVPCGHDHQALVFVSSGSASAVSPMNVASLPAASDTHASTRRLLAMASRASPGVSPLAASIPLALASALRL
jgi:hypothetical protein